MTDKVTDKENIGEGCRYQIRQPVLIMENIYKFYCCTSVFSQIHRKEKLSAVRSTGLASSVIPMVLFSGRQICREVL